jgi:predicted phosphodiesterase
MRIAVFSDIHGNGVALEAVLADIQAQAPDRLVCLGDAIQGGPQPAQVVRRLRELHCPVVMGNADAWLLTGEETGDEAITSERLQAMKAVRLWTLAQLSDDHRAFIAAFQPTVELALDLDDKFTLLAYHGSPKSFDDVILPDIAQDKLADYLRGHTADAYCGGHTHVQFVRRVGAGPQVHFNPGSVGLAYSHHQPDEGFQMDHWAEYAMLAVEDNRFALEFHRVPFDVAALMAIYPQSGRPHSASALAQYRGR